MILGILHMMMKGNIFFYFTGYICKHYSDKRISPVSINKLPAVAECLLEARMRFSLLSDNTQLLY